MISTNGRAVEREVIHIISKTKAIRPERLLFNAQLFKDIDLDAVDVVDIILALEKKFDINIPDEVPLHTVGDFVYLVTSQILNKTS